MHKKHKTATKQKHEKHKKRKKHKTETSEYGAFFLVDVFKHMKMLPFFILFAYIPFVLFVHVKSFRKKKEA